MHNISYNSVQIPRKAALLAVQLSKTLAPLFTPDSQQSSSVEFDTWGEDEDAWKDRQGSFTRIFEIGLRLKTATVSTDMRYSFVIHNPGTSLKTRVEQPTSIWKLASIHMYMLDEKEQGDPIAEAVIQPRNFCNQALDPSRTLHTISIVIPKSECPV
jgi:hypothetical protein